MIRLERIWDPDSRGAVLLSSGLITLLIALSDWWTKPYVSLGFLYLFPIMLAAAFVPRWVIVVMSLCCAGLSDQFSSLEHSQVRLAFEALALAGRGLFVGELIRNRRLTIAAQARFKALVETSPAAIVTVDERGFVEAANQAATQLLSPREGSLVGSPIAAFLPELHHGLRREEAPQFRASMQCRAHRGNGETFTADVWFSTYKEGAQPKLAAIIADVSSEDNGGTADEALDESRQDRPTLAGRETDVLRLIVQGLANKEIAARMDISESTVKNTLQQLFSKTGVRTRAQLVRVALELYRDVL
jgi:PAS domain S-box-containing protein